MKRKAKVLQALEKLLLSAEARHGEVNCPECESPMQLLKFYFRIYGIRQKRSLPIPICTKCNVGGLESLKHYQYI
jgi:transposase-like protein